MNIFITAGTLEFLKITQRKFSKENMVLMLNNEHALLVHETNGSTFFQAPRKYEVIDSHGQLNHKGFVAMNNISIADEGKPVFEYQVKNRQRLTESMPGFKAIRFLKPLNSNTYIIFTLWENEKSYQNWKNSNVHSQIPGNGEFNTKSNLFTMPPYITTYFIYTEENSK
ncbi:antibiotic biosynthesis monooxygenase family protein [Bacillus sp. CGMCC 1.16607]|uniref:antibiotic biosynthesis monooxygenase family protein n=1 Tax=Bacillus sp. CGMCC 1.16607 TaxID=3351842 RepID=UPI0036424664